MFFSLFSFCGSAYCYHHLQPSHPALATSGCCGLLATFAGPSRWLCRSGSVRPRCRWHVDSANAGSSASPVQQKVMLVRSVEYVQSSLVVSGPGILETIHRSGASRVGPRQHPLRRRHVRPLLRDEIDSRRGLLSCCGRQGVVAGRSPRLETADPATRS